MVDCHTHTHNSFDAENDTVNERCEKALQLGLDVMAVTDHCEVNRFYDKEHYEMAPDCPYDGYGYYNVLENSLSETTEAKELYGDKFNLLCGVELGQPLSDIEATERLISDSRLDFVIASMHQMDGYEDFAFLEYSEETVPELLEKDFKEILRIAEWGKYDVLGHITYALRYIQGEQGIAVDMERYDDIIERILVTAIEKGKGIEINTSGLRQKYGDTFPSLKYIKWYRELGGEIITIGSDSHSTSDLGKGISDGIELARQAGFKRISYFKGRKPYFINI